MPQKRYFPSYSKIHQKILVKKQQTHLKQMDLLTKKINHLQKTFNLTSQHNQLKRTLLQTYHSTSQQQMKTLLQSLYHQEQKLEDQNDGKYFIQANVESLNYCIDQDTEEDNHYQNHLRFKKQVLERNLYQNKNHHHLRGKYDQEYIFKNLYNRPKTSNNNKKPSKNTTNYKNTNKQGTKQNSTNFYIVQKSRPNSSLLRKIKSVKNLTTIKPNTEHQMIALSQQQECEKNIKKLKQNYGKYLKQKQLQNTNIIKWRIFGS